jgi:hypothetical protein
MPAARRLSAAGVAYLKQSTYRGSTEVQMLDQQEMLMPGFDLVFSGTFL